MGVSMAVTVRLSDKEQEMIRKKAVEINQILIKKGMQPMRDSQLIHKTLEMTIPKLEVSESGTIIISE